MGSLLLSPGPSAQASVVPSKSLFPRPEQVLAALWWVNGNLLQEGLRHTHTQSRCPCSRPLLTHASRRSSHTVLSESLWGPVSWRAQGLFEPPERFWRVSGMILNVILPLPLSCWGFSFALCPGVSPHSCLSAAQPLLQHLQSCWGFSAMWGHPGRMGHGGEC